jgi:hypothetical protein
MTEKVATDQAASGNLGITLLVSQIEKARDEMHQTVVPKSKSGGFIRVKYIHGRPYYYLVKSVRVAGKVKQKVLKYLGTRKPGGYALRTRRV